MCRAEELAQRRGLTSELDETWSDVGKKANPRWLRHAIDHHRGTVEDNNHDPARHHRAVSRPAR